MNRVVYYAQFDELVKIGTTTDICSRMRSLKPDAVLAVEPGGRALEMQRHRQFKADHVVSEYFRPSPELLQHIQGLDTPFDYKAPSEAPDHGPIFRKIDEIVTAFVAAEQEERVKTDALIKAVRRAHAKAGISQAELARHTGRHRNTIAEWCS